MLWPQISVEKKKREVLPGLTPNCRVLPRNTKVNQPKAFWNLLTNMTSFVCFIIGFSHRQYCQVSYCKYGQCQKKMHAASKCITVHKNNESFAKLHKLFGCEKRAIAHRIWSKSFRKLTELNL